MNIVSLFYKFSLYWVSFIVTLFYKYFNELFIKMLAMLTNEFGPYSVTSRMCGLRE